MTLVLNSLTSAGFKETSLACCAHGAHFIEIGKLNVWNVDQVAELRPDIRYQIFDLVSSSGDESVRRSFEELSASFEAGTFTALPFTLFALEHLRAAFHFFQQAKHIGKIVVRMPTPELSPAEGRVYLRHSFFDPEATYLVTGGLGGLGVEVARWMTGTGAKHVVLAGRNPPSRQLRALFDRLEVCLTLFTSFTL